MEREGWEVWEWCYSRVRRRIESSSTASQSTTTNHQSPACERKLAKAQSWQKQPCARRQWWGGSALPWWQAPKFLKAWGSLLWFVFANKNWQYLLFRSLYFSSVLSIFLCQRIQAPACVGKLPAGPKKKLTWQAGCPVQVQGWFLLRTFYFLNFYMVSSCSNFFLYSLLDDFLLHL